MKKSGNSFLFLILIVLAGCVSHSPTETLSPNPDRILVTPTTTPAPKATSSFELGDTLVSSVDGATMVFVQKGEFKMGAEFGLTDEQPTHTVMLDSYWLDKTEVTNAMYNQCVLTGKCERPNVLGSYEDPQTSFDRFDNQKFKDHPVAFVSWNDAKNYCTWASRRLPTEAEWEKAAIWDPISNTQQLYPWGNEFNCKRGNYDDELKLDASIMPDTPANCDGFARSSPVGSFPEGESAYGALDMGGNVWEWVNDAFLETDPFTDTLNYYAVSPIFNPPGVDPALSEYRVMRGGSWNLTFGFGRGTYRLWYGLDDTYDGIGFRCALSE